MSGRSVRVSLTTYLPERQVDGAMLGDGFFEDGGVVGRAVAFGAERADVDPGIAGRQVGKIGLNGGGHDGERRGLEDVAEWRGTAPISAKLRPCEKTFTS